jgi:glycosyltransferase involved in cell wall biosynthesis
VKVLALQRESHVAAGVLSLSVAARITEVLDYLYSRGELNFTEISETDPTAPRAVDWCDVLVLSKHSSMQAVALAKQARNSGKRILYDIDDWVFSFPKYSGGRFHNNREELIKELITLSNIITVANQTLYKRMRLLVPSLALVPNGMWVNKYIKSGIVPQIESEPPRIVFTNADFLKLQSAKDILLSALQVFFIRHPEYVLDFYGDPFPEIFSMPFLHFTNRMPYSEYMQALVSGQYQFAITPLGGEEDIESAEFNSCKNPFKYLNYGAAGVPGIYSNAKIYRDCVVDGKTGLLVNNDFSSWVNALEKMASDRDLRARIRTAAFNDILNNYNICYSANALKKVLA